MHAIVHDSLREESHRNRDPYPGSVDWALHSLTDVFHRTKPQRWGGTAASQPSWLCAETPQSRPRSVGGTWLVDLADGLQISAHWGCGYGLAGTNGQATPGFAVCWRLSALCHSQ